MKEVQSKDAKLLPRVHPAKFNPVRCLILACGNTLRGDDGVGPWLAAWAEKRFAANPAVRVISRQQWTPDLAEDLARVESVIFIDCALDTPAGALCLRRVQPGRGEVGLATHHTDAAELLSLCEELYARLAPKALLLTIGAASVDMGENLSELVRAALPQACKALEEAVLDSLANAPR